MPGRASDHSDVLPRVQTGETLEGAGPRGECRGDKCNCSIMDPPEV